PLRIDLLQLAENSSILINAEKNSYSLHFPLQGSFPVGAYEVTKPTRINLALRNLKGQATLFVIALPGGSKEADGSAKVVFHRYGNEYFLSLVSTGSWLSTYRLQMSKEERRIADASPRPQL